MIDEVIGQELFEKAVSGYNCACFTYGQTGAGKKYTLYGYDKNVYINIIVGNDLSICSEVYR